MTVEEQSGSKPYNYEEYWLQNGARTTHDNINIFNYSFEIYQEQEKKLKEVLKSLHWKVESVLELGCGFGRVTKMIMDEVDPNICIACDISPYQVGNAMRCLNNYERIFYRIIDVIKDPMTWWQSDLVIASEMLMHIPQDKIESVMKKMVKASTKYILNVDYWEYNADIKRLANHNFYYPYNDIWIKMDEVKMVDVHPLPKTKQAIFLVTKK